MINDLKCIHTLLLEESRDLVEIQGKLRYASSVY